MKFPKVNVSGKLVLPIIEGGKGIGVTNGVTAGNFAKNGAVGTFSAVNATSYDDAGNPIPQVYNPNHTRREKFEQLIKYSVDGALAQSGIAHELSCGNGRVHMNILWEAGGAKRIIEDVLSRAKGVINGITCGAGLPYDLAEVASKYKTYYYPIVSSVRAFRVLWKRAYHKFNEFLGAVVYEDPWLAGGHSGLSNQENPSEPQAAYERIVEIRKFMRLVNLDHVPIVLAGGVWCLKELLKFIDNKEVGNISFQFGTRPLLTQESPISNNWKQMLFKLKKEDILLNKFSPTGLYSLAIKNNFLKGLINKKSREVEISKEMNEDFNSELLNSRGKISGYIKKQELSKIQEWKEAGYTAFLKTPERTVVFVTPEEARKIKQDQAECMGCLSECKFSNWSEKREGNTTSELPDPRSFCIQKTLQDVINYNKDINNNLVFAGSNAYRFASDPFYENNFIPTIKQLVERIMTGG